MLRLYFIKFICTVVMIAASMPVAVWAQQSSVSAWDAADFRIWGYIPYWTTTSQINGFATNGLYNHVSDVLYFGGLRPNSNGTLSWASSTYQTQFNTIRAQSAANGFTMHLSMFEVIGGQTDATWEAIIADPAKRATFVSQLKTIMLGNVNTTADDVKGFNFDWERPSSAAEWGNYTQLARELRNSFKNPNDPNYQATKDWEISVCDYGSTDARWDDTALFDAKVYDQIMIMGYHYGASSYVSFANGKKNLTQQGAAKAFSDNQITIGVGTWGDGAGSEATSGLSAIVAANPNLPYDALTFTGTIGNTTGTWNIESRKQVREKTQLAIDRGMPGMFTWTLHYDATNNLGLHRVMHHYAMVKRDIPDLNLDGTVDARDGYALADNTGSMIANTGMATAAQMDAYYLNGNWEKGDHDGNGFINQSDADWLAARFTALNINIPDRLPFKGTFDNFPSSLGIVGRWKAGRNAQNKLVETGNFKQESSNYLLWSSYGQGGKYHSNSFVTIRNQTSAEMIAGLNGASRAMQADLATSIDLGQNQDTYVKFLVRENTAALTASQLAANNRNLTLDFLSSSGASQFDIAFRGLTHQFGIDSVADALGQDVASGGFASDTTYMVIAKISGNGVAANTIFASLYAVGDMIGNVTDPSYQWMLTAQSGVNFNPTITGIQFTSSSGANYTVSNVWIGNALAMFPASGLGAALDPLMAVPEPAGLVLMLLGTAMTLTVRARESCTSYYHYQ